MKGDTLLTLPELGKMVSQGQIETIVVGFVDHIGRLLGKRYDAQYAVDHVLNGGSKACDYLLTTDMEMEPLKGFEFANWEKGYGDFRLIVDDTAIYRLSWHENSLIAFCDITDKKENRITIAPRSVLKQQIKRLHNMGLKASVASELEYYTFNTNYDEAQRTNYQELKATGWYLEDYHLLQSHRTEEFHSACRRYLKNCGIKVEGTKGEWGKGQHEFNISPQDPLTMADHHILLKQCLKELAIDHGISVSFMAKYAQDQAGSSCHIHLSLWQDDRNVFVGDQQLGQVTCSTVFMYFLGGWIDHVYDVMPFYAPTVNSYKRYVDGSWAPTRLAWSLDNRTAGFRVVGTGNNLRIECRIPGADCNPYLAFAAALASGMDGIQNSIEPPPQFIGDVYEAHGLKRVPHSLLEAVEHFENSEFAIMTFGKEVVEHYSHYFRQEHAAYQLAVTDWERRRYFERI